LGIAYTTGSLFDSHAQTLVNPVNTAGAMGKGLAYQFQQRYPEMFRQYRDMCQRGEFAIGDLWLYRGTDRWVLNFPTKTHWRGASKVEYIERGLQRFCEVYEEWEITSIAFPALGCGEGGLDFESQVGPLMHEYLRDLLLDIFLYKPAVD